MRRLAFLLIIAAVLSTFFATGLKAQDVIYTKDGSMYKGPIVEEVPNVRIVIQDIAGNQHSVQWDNIDRIMRGEWTGKKSATLSWALSFFLLPGLGQFYNGDNGKGAIMLVLGIGGGTMMLASDDPDVVGYGALIYLGDWIWSFIDAPIRSASINRTRGYAGDLSFPTDDSYYSLLSVKKHGMQSPVLVPLVRVRF